MEGAKHLITVITDHKHLQYIKSAKCLNSSQTHWALFFTRFNSIITYRPGSKNTQADALSRSFLRVHEVKSVETTIIPAASIVAGITRDLHSQSLLQQDQAPEKTPPGILFVP